MKVAFKPAGTDWIGYHAFPARAEDMAWHRFMRHATLRQLTRSGFPTPGDPYWTAETLAGVAARYPSLDMTPWQAAHSRPEHNAQDDWSGSRRRRSVLSNAVGAGLVGAGPRAGRTLS